MQQETLKDFEHALIKACDDHIRDGGNIISNSYMRDSKNCCAIFALLKENRFSNFTNAEKISNLLGKTISYYEVVSFIRGFDNSNESNIPYDMEAFELGIKLRKKYVEKQTPYSIGWETTFKK